MKGAQPGYLNLRNGLLLFFTIVLSCNIFYKYSDINPRYDEVGAVQTILSAKYYGEADVYKKIWEQKIPDSSYASAKSIFFKILPYIVVPVRWTYALSIYPVVAFLVSDADSIWVLKFKGIIGFSLLHIFGFIFFSRLLFRRFNVSIPTYIFIAVTISFGVDYIHYARSATTYALLILGICMQVYSLCKIREYIFSPPAAQKGRIYLYLFLYAFTVELNHQFIITYPFLLLFLGYYLYRKNISFTKAIFYLALPSVIFFCDVLFLLLRSRILNLHSNPGQNVLSNGVYGEYLITNYKGIWETAVYFFKNGSLFIHYSLAGFYKPEYAGIAYLTGVVFLVYMVFCGVSIYRVYKERKEKGMTVITPQKKMILAFIGVNFFVFLILIGLGKLNLSPTRHSLFFSILFYLFIAIVSIHLSWKTNLFFCIFFSALTFFSFWKNVNGEYVDSRFDPTYIVKYAKQNDCKTIILEPCWMYPLFSNQMNQQFNLLYRCGSRVWNNDTSGKARMIYVTPRSEIIEKRADYLSTLISDAGSFQCIDSLSMPFKDGYGYNMYLYVRK